MLPQPKRHTTKPPEATAPTHVWVRVEHELEVREEDVHQQEHAREDDEHRLLCVKFVCKE